MTRFRPNFLFLFFSGRNVLFLLEGCGVSSFEKKSWKKFKAIVPISIALSPHCLHLYADIFVLSSSCSLDHSFSHFFLSTSLSFHFLLNPFRSCISTRTCPSFPPTPHFIPRLSPIASSVVETSLSSSSGNISMGTTLLA